MKRPLSVRQRHCLMALARQGEWPARDGEWFGWRGATGTAVWAPNTQKLLTELAAMGFARDDGIRTVTARVVGDGAIARSAVRTVRFTITDEGREMAAQQRKKLTEKG